MATQVEKPKHCTLLIHLDSTEPPQVHNIKKDLEEGTTEQKIAALKKTILLMINGEQFPQLLMPIIRFVMTSKDHTIKKLLLLYWEIVDKKSADGKLLSEMILVCNALLSDLNHSNEYIRGSTLRFLCKLREPELLDPLIESVKNNLEHRHSYPRRNAVLAIYSIFKSFPHLIPDAPDVILEFLKQESDPSCKRNAFIMLFNSDQDKAVAYLSTILDQAAAFGELLQLIIVETIRKVCRTTPTERSKYMRCIFTLLGSTSPAVQYESAITLVTLSTAPTAIKASAQTFINLLVKESDNNVKMIVLDRLLDIKKKYSKILQELIMDVLRALSSPHKDIRRKTLDIALDLVSPQNINEVVLLFKKEIQRTQSEEFEQKTGDYRQMLIEAIHYCAVKFPDVASSSVHLLMDFLGDPNPQSAIDVIAFARDVVQTYPELRESIVRKLLESLFQIQSPKVYRAALWIVGEYSESMTDIEFAFSTLKDSLGEPKFSELEKDRGIEESENLSTPNLQIEKGPVVLPDGTYKTISAMETKSSSISNKATLRSMILAGDYFLASVLSTTMMKLVLKAFSSVLSTSHKQTLHALVLLYLTSFLRLGKSGIAPPIDEDSFERISLCIKILCFKDDVTRDVYVSKCRESFASMLENKIELAKKREEKSEDFRVQVDDLIKIGQLREGRKYGVSNIEDEDELNLEKATGFFESQTDLMGRLNRIVQLTGFSDPIYAEAFVNVHEYDIVLDVVIVNQTSDTLQNLSLELATLGDLKLCERPQTYTLAPYGTLEIKANIKVSSTETAIIFGSLVYDVAGASSDIKPCIVLNEIHIDIIEMISPAHCDDFAFRSMWAEFEWENKVAVNTNFKDLNEYLKHITKSTNMLCLTPSSSLDGECGFLAANLYAKSVFGEDALANVSIEKQAENKIGGFIRIRSKTQGIALSLGEKITQNQKIST
eukprot:TRINITY_DN7877_c0_g1_i3.p1 TRINITY_DN7877_c0_g1~~TRINITY_DN7877_c0_g1_i3.p1  ORF type:complete len:987 (-),score=216.27 TRINITY_DN7877_c0_g1_i3:10-2841(-)